MSNAPRFSRNVRREVVSFDSLESILLNDGLKDAFTGESMGNTGETVARDMRLAERSRMSSLHAP